MRHSVGSEYKQLFSTTLATYCLTIFLHPSVILDFGAPNPGIHHTSCSQRRRGRHLGGIPLALEVRCWWPQCVGVTEARLRPPMRLPGASTSEIDGCWLAAWRHCLGGFLAVWSWHSQALEFRSRKCRRKSPFVMRVRRARPLRLRAFPLVFWCVPQGPTCWPDSWVSFCPTQHNLSHRHYLQYLPPMWRHYLGWQEDWVTWFDCTFFVRGLNFFFRLWRPPVQRGRGRRSQWALGPRGRCRRAMVGQATCLLLGGRWVRMSVSLGGRRPGGWHKRGLGRLLGPPLKWIKWKNKLKIFSRSYNNKSTAECDIKLHIFKLEPCWWQWWNQIKQTKKKLSNNIEH